MISAQTPSTAPSTRPTPYRSAGSLWRSHAIAAVAAVLVSATPACPRLNAQNITAALPNTRLVLEREIGSESGPEEYSFGMIADVAVDGEHSVYVLDVMAANIKVYDAAGIYVRSFGRSGAGPGEFVRPLKVQADSVVRVLDMAQNRISVFGLDGQLRETVRLPSVRGINVTTVFQLRNGKLIASTTPGLSWGSPAHQESVTVFLENPGTFEIDTVLTCHSGATIWYVPNRPAPWGVADADFGPGGGWTLNDSLIALVDGYAATVRWYRIAPGGLELRREERLPFESRAVSHADLGHVKRAFRESRERIGQTLPAFELQAPRRWSVGTGAFFASDGGLWIRNGRSSDRQEVRTVFPASGAAPRVLTLPGAFSLRVATPDRLYGVWAMEAGTQVVRVYAWR